MGGFCRQRTRNLGRRFAAQLAADHLSGAKQLVEVDAGFYAKALEHVDDVFAGDVAAAPLA